MISISTQAVSAALRQSVLRMQSDLAKVSKEVSTGQLADIGLSLGAGTGQSVTLRQEQSRLTTIQNTNNVVSTRLSSTQSALDDVLSSAQSFLSSLIGATGTGADSSSLQALQAQAKDNLQALTSSMNTTVGGQYIFGGVNTDVKPMSDYLQQPAGGAKQAVDAAFQSAFGMAQSDPNVSTISSSAMQNFLAGPFAALFQGSGWTSDWSAASSQTVRSRISSSELIDTSVTADQPAFQQLAMAYTMVTELGSQNLSTDAMQTVIGAATQAINTAVQDVTNLQAGVGQTQSAVTDANNQISVQLTVLGTNLDNLEGIDSYDVSTQVSNLQTQLEASYEITNQLHQLSLVNYLTNA
jgi:flagellar hook-associated protein 3 FlgL